MEARWNATGGPIGGPIADPITGPIGGSKNTIASPIISRVLTHLSLSLSYVLFVFVSLSSWKAAMAQVVYWIMGQRAGPEPPEGRTWEYIVGPFNTIDLARRHLNGMYENGYVPVDFCVIDIKEKRVWRS